MAVAAQQARVSVRRMPAALRLGATVSEPPRSARLRAVRCFLFLCWALPCYFVNRVLFCGCGCRAPYPRLLFSFAGRIASCRAARGWPVGRHRDGQFVRAVN